MLQHQIDTLQKKNVEGQLQIICGDITNRCAKPVKITAADRVQMVMYKNMLAKRILRKDTAKSYIVNNDCIRCGICAKGCPANNITVTTR